MLGTAYFPKQYKISIPTNSWKLKQLAIQLERWDSLYEMAKLDRFIKSTLFQLFFQYSSPTSVRCFCKEKKWLFLECFSLRRSDHTQTTLLFGVVLHQINSIFIVSDFLVASSDLIKAIMPFQLTTITLIRWITTRKKRKQLPKLIKLVYPYLQTAIKSVDFSPVSNFSTHQRQGMVGIHSQLNSEREILWV